MLDAPAQAESSCMSSEMPTDFMFATMRATILAAEVNQRG